MPTPPVPVWLEIREPGSGKLLCKYDPHRELLEFVRRRVRTIVDLKQYQDRVRRETDG